jgi:hypothetical protein
VWLYWYDGSQICKESAKFTIRTLSCVAGPTIFTTRISCGCICTCVGAQLRSPVNLQSVGVHLRVGAQLRSPSTYNLSEFIYVLELNYEVRQPKICRSSSTCWSSTTKSVNLSVGIHLRVGAQLRSPSTYISVGVHLRVGAQLRSPSTYLSEFIYVSELNYEVCQPTYLSEFIYVSEISYESSCPSTTCRSQATKSVASKLCRRNSTALSYGHCLMLFAVNIHHEVTRVSIRRAEVHYVYYCISNLID